MTGRVADQPTEVSVRAVITRADGTVIDVGQIAGQYRSPWRQAWWRLVRRPLANRRIRSANRSIGS